MKCLRKLFRGFWGLAAQVGILGAVLLAMVLLALFTNGDYILEILLFFLLLIFLALVGLVIFGIVVLSQYEKVKQELWKIPGFSPERLEREAPRAPKIKNMVICSDAICYYGNTFLPKVLPLRDVVWAYQSQEPGEGRGVMICTQDGEKALVPVMIKHKQSDAAMRYVLRLIARKNKNALIGYGQEYEYMFRQDLGGLRLRVQQGGSEDSALLEQEYLQMDYYTKDFQ